jgi:hypothetical protein
MFRLCFVSLLGLAVCSSAHAAFTNLGTILPLGDSLTSGQTISTYIPGGYRDPFYQDAVAAGLTMQFVGTTTFNSTPLLDSTNQNEYCAYAGYEIDSDPSLGRGGIDDTYKSLVIGQDDLQPNWILLWAGASDISVGNVAGFGTRYAGLLSDIHADDPAAKVICGSLPPDLAEPTSDVTTANQEIQADVAADQLLGWNVDFSDIGSSYTSADMIDVYHPDQVGDDLAGAAWLAAIQNYSNTSQVPEPASIGIIASAGLLLLRRRRSV